MPEPSQLLTPELYAAEQRALRDCSTCQRFTLIRRQLREFTGDAMPRQDRERIEGALQVPEDLHRLTRHPRFAAHQLAIVRQRQDALRPA